MTKLKLCLIYLIISEVIAKPSVSTTNSLVASSKTTPLNNDQMLNDGVKEAENSPEIPTTLQIYLMKSITKVRNRFATTLVTSKARNYAATAQNTTYSVILPDTGYITGFVMQVDGNTYPALVKEKLKAKNIYENAVNSGENAAHVATARDSNCFTISVNVKPRSELRFRLTYEQLLQRQNDQYEIVINIHPGQPVKDLSAEVHINESLPLKFVRIPPLRSGNEIGNDDHNSKLNPQAEIINVNDVSTIVKFYPDVEQQKQFARNLGMDENNGLSGQIVVQYDVKRNAEGGEILINDGFFVHFFAPKHLKSLTKQVVFVLDTSGSMSGQRIMQLKKAMSTILSELTPKDLFNIVEFNSNIRVWDIEQIEPTFEEMNAISGWTKDSKIMSRNINDVPLAFEATEDLIENAKQSIQKFDAEGGTNIISALKFGLKIAKRQREQKPSQHHQIIIFLTDGEATEGETASDLIMKAVQEIQLEPKVPIFCLSFGSGADRELVNQISLDNSGFTRHIYEGIDSSIQLENFYKTISTPLLKNVQFKYVSDSDEIIFNEVTRSEFPTYFAGGEFVVSGRFEGTKDFANSIKIVGNKADGTSLELVPDVSAPVGRLERVWAYLTVKQALEDAETVNNKSVFLKKARDISLKYSFVTPLSSLTLLKSDNEAEEMPVDMSLTRADGSKIQKEDEDTYMGDVREDDKTPSVFRYPTTFINKLSAELLWLKNVLTDSDTLALSKGNFQLTKQHPQWINCSYTPNGEKYGYCEHLAECPQVFPYLTDETVYEQFFCAIDTYAGICCPYSQGLA